MKKASILLIVLALCTIFTACQPATPPKPKASVNTGLISLIGQPLRYFKDNLDWENAEQDLELSYGPPVARYTLDGIEYHFNNMVGYTAITEDTPCTQILVKYTELLPGIKQGELTDNVIRELFGEYTDEHGYQRYSTGYAHIDFTVDENRDYEDSVKLSLNWEFRFTPSTLFTARENPDIEISLNAELVSLIGQPFSYFEENFGWRLSDLERSSSLEPYANEYTVDGITYMFNNDILSDDMLCTGIRANYTELLPGIKRGALSEEILRELIGEQYLVCGREDQYGLDSAYIHFKIDENGNYEDSARLSIDWEFRQR